MAEETQNPVLGVEQPRPPQETTSSFNQTSPSYSSPSLADSSSSSSTSLSSSQEVQQVGQHLEDGHYFYGGDENHLFYKFYGHNSEGLPVSMKYALIYDPLPHGFRRTETKVEQIGRTWKNEKKQRKKQEKIVKKQQKQSRKVRR
jgi:hypothetical protein